MLRSIVISLLLAYLFSPTLFAQPGFGTVCVVWNSAKPPTHVLTESYNPATLKLRIDKRPAVLWPHKDDLKLENLDLSERHLVVLTSDGKPIESFGSASPNSIRMNCA
jgi:hypothetical protein